MSPVSNDPDDASGPAGLAEVFDRFTFGSDRRVRRHHQQKRPETVEAPGARAQEEVHREWPPEEPGHGWPQEEVDADWPREEDWNLAPHVDEPGGSASPTTPRDTAASIRPYAWTGGRTKSAHRLELETLVSTSEQCHAARLERVEHHSIADLCRHPRSVAEVGATLGVPLGVAKVLLGDMAELGLVVVHRTVTDSGSAPHLDLMERVLSGLRRL